MSIRIEKYHGAEIANVIEDLGRLRIEVFRDFPYLYEGSLDYERNYLQTYVNAPASMLAIVWDGLDAVGATTCIPLRNETEEVQEPFVKAGLNLDEIFYFGESILLSSYRGLGLGKHFFELREAHAAAHAWCKMVCFCAVERPESHPLRPAGYRPLDGFWQGLGYEQRSDLKAGFQWQDIGEAHSSIKPMVFWAKSID
jgi:GNAT superfamily N-acetyltransferase